MMLALRALKDREREGESAGGSFRAEGKERLLHIITDAKCHEILRRASSLFLSISLLRASGRHRCRAFARRAFASTLSLP